MEQQSFSPRHLTLENQWMQVVLDPADGGRVISLKDTATQTPLIWTNERTEHVQRYYACNYDDLSNSGIEEAFPTVQPCPFEDIQQLPFFGEVWTLPWKAEKIPEGYVLSCKSPSFPAELQKTFSFSEDGKTLVTRYQIHNIGTKDFPYIFGVHPSLTLYQDSALYAPEEHYTLYVSMPEKADGNSEMDWPVWNGIDFRKARPSDSLGCYNLVAMPVQGNHYGVVHTGRGVGLDVAYDPAYFRCLSLWPIYGGFRGHTCLMSEVFTCYPASLDEAVELGLATVLKKGDCHTTTVSYRILTEYSEEE